jgi:insertion element IS1 protein InsB
LIRSEGQKTQKPIILSAYQERISLRGLSRVFDIHRQGISRWIVKHMKSLPKLKETFLPANPDDVLEHDEAWSFVLKRS